MRLLAFVSALALIGSADVSTNIAHAQARAETEMARYYLVLLRRGPAWTSDPTPEARAVSAAHMANIEALIEAGTMVVAGPLEDEPSDSALTGIFILRVESMEEAEAAVATDPGVQAGRFTYDILPWWGPATLRY
jgi:uncharacterized protein YciI